jgi:17beta-estradiol 17-dehydrogenase / very-long-chain 3-oxoacyl-CoA reductase
LLFFIKENIIMASIVLLAMVAGQIKEAEPTVAVLALIGALGLALVFTKASKAAFKTFIRPGKKLKKLGKWAVVTGATDGIGKAYALALAEQGLSIVLISRTEAKLQDVQKEIDAKGYEGVETKYVVCDYSNFDQKAKNTVAAAIKGLDVGVLINNVGVSYRYPMYFDELTDDEVSNLIEMNVNSTTYMTKLVIGGMVERKRGAIVNISSGSAMYTLPLLAEYSAAKSYIEKLSRAINAEYSKKGVTCQCQIPFYVATKLAKMRKSLMVPTPEQYVAHAIKWVGYPDAVASPFFLHALQGWVLDQLPDAIVTKIIMNMHLATRKRGQKKDAIKAAEAKSN